MSATATAPTPTTARPATPRPGSSAAAPSPAPPAAPPRAAGEAAATPAAAPLTFAGIELTTDRLLPFKPGAFKFVHWGKAQDDATPVDGVVATFICGERSGEFDRPIHEAVAAARARLVHVREEFREHPIYQRYVRLRECVQKLQGDIAAAAERPQECLAEARRLLLADESPEPAEAAYREAVAQVTLLDNRSKAMTGAVTAARDDAHQALVELIQAERRVIEAEAIAEANRLAAQITAAVGPILQRLLAAHNVAGRLSSHRAMALSWAERAASPLADLERLP